MRAGALAALIAAACGGAPAPPPAAVTPEPTRAQAPDPEEYAAVSAYFGRRRPAVSQCYADALAAKKVDPRARGYVAVALVVEPTGKPSNVHISDATLESDAVKECVVRLVETWLLPRPSAPIDFSFSYNFLPE
jgi:hypothetical protein